VTEDEPIPAVVPIMDQLMPLSRVGHEFRIGYSHGMGVRGRTSVKPNATLSYAITVRNILTEYG